MRKTFCDHCGKEIRGAEINEITIEECFFDYGKNEHIGYGYELCGDCYRERNQQHIALDMAFFRIGEKYGEVEELHEQP